MAKGTTKERVVFSKRKRMKKRKHGTAWDVVMKLRPLSCLVRYSTHAFKGMLSVNAVQVWADGAVF